MENLDLTAVARMGLILAHLLAFAAAFAAVAFGDFAIFRRRRVDTELLTKAANAYGWQVINMSEKHFQKYIKTI